MDLYINKPINNVKIEDIFSENCSEKYKPVNLSLQNFMAIKIIMSDTLALLNTVELIILLMHV